MKKLHWANLFTLVLLMGIMVSLVAATGQQAPSLAITRAPGPELTLMNSDDLEPAGIGIETPTKESSRVDSVAVINSESASGYSRIDLAGVDNSNPSFNPQAAGVEAGLTVSVNGLVTAEADEAYVVIIPPTIYSPSGSPQPISAKTALR